MIEQIKLGMDWHNFEPRVEAAKDIKLKRLEKLVSDSVREPDKKSSE